MEFINEAVLHAAGQWWIYPILLVFFFVDGFAMVVPSETLIVALAAFSRHSGEPNLWILGLTALTGAIAGDNMAYLLGRKIGLDRWKWMRRPKVQKAFAWARYELEKRGAVLIFTARYIPWGRVAVNYVAGTTGFPHRRFFLLDAFACVTWVGYSVGIGIVASSFPWLHHNPLLGAGIAVVFAIILGIAIDHVLRWWHKRLGRNDVLPEPEAGYAAPEAGYPEPEAGYAAPDAGRAAPEAKTGFAEPETDGAKAAGPPERSAEGHDGGRLGRALPVSVTADAEPGR